MVKILIALTLILAISCQEIKYEIEVLKEGNGTFPKKGDNVKVHYEGRNTLKDGVFDSSYNRGDPLNLTAGIGQVIKCWDDMLTTEKLSLGGKIKVRCPASSAYGENGIGGVISPNEDLLFTMELMEINKN